MKTIIGIFLVTSIILLSSCEVVGPPGPPGMDGLDGDSFIGSIFEIQGDFTPGNDYTLYYEFPGNFEIYNSDVVLVYILWEQADGIDVWRLLPQTVVLSEGVLQYNFDYTVNDVQVFLEGTIDFGTLVPAEWQNQVFRIAVLPADFAHKETVDIQDLGAIMKSPEIKFNMEKINHLDNQVSIKK